MRGMYEQLIVTSVLLGQPNTYSATLQRLAKHAAPGDVKRATEYIEAHLHLPLTLADVAKAAGVPGRTLLEHFREHRGISPMRYMRDARFGRVRDALLAPVRKQSVTQIAVAWRFSHSAALQPNTGRGSAKRPPRLTGAVGAARPDLRLLNSRAECPDRWRSRSPAPAFPTSFSSPLPGLLRSTPQCALARALRTTCGMVVERGLGLCDVAIF
jgi:AraC-like DNA-binding protein